MRVMNPEQIILGPGRLSRRDFVQKILAAYVGVVATSSPAASGENAVRSPFVVFSKVYQELNLSFEEAAAVTADAGLDGIDPPVRTGGEVSPEKAEQELPRYYEALQKHNLKLPLLTTGITSASSPYTESLLRTAKKLGVQYYRLGFIERQVDIRKQVREVRAHLKDLAAVNKELGIGALLQNHSPDAQTTYFGGYLPELVDTVDGFDPSQIGVAFDIAHALVVHGDDWRKYFEELRPHFRIAYIKDVTRTRKWVPFGHGAIGSCGYFELLRQSGYHAPLSLHIEFDWSNSGRNKNRMALVRALKESSAVVRNWLSA